MFFCGSFSCWAEIGGSACALLGAFFGLFRCGNKDAVSNTFLDKLFLFFSLAISCLATARFVFDPESSVFVSLAVSGAFAVCVPMWIAHKLRKEDSGVVVRVNCLVLFAIGAACFAYAGLTMKSFSLVAIVFDFFIALALAVLAFCEAAHVFLNCSKEKREEGYVEVMNEVLRERARVPKEELSTLKEFEEEAKQKNGVQEDAEKEEELEEPQDELESRRFLLKLIWSEIDLVLGALALSLLLVCLNLGQSFVWGRIVALVSSSNSESSELLRQCVNLLLIVVVFGMALGLQQVLVKVASLRISTSARLMLFSAVLQRSLAFHNSVKPGELMSRLSNDTDAVASTSSELTTAIKVERNERKKKNPLLLNGFKGIVMLVFGLVLLFVLNWSLSLILLASVPVVAIITYILSKRNSAITAKTLDAQAKSTSCAEEASEKGGKSFFF